MSYITASIPSTPLVLQMRPAFEMTDEQFFELCQLNPNYRIERTAKGELIIMPPVGGVSGNREADLIGLLWTWNHQTQLGKVFSSSTIFRLPSGGVRSPDAAWVRLDRWEALPEEDQEKFPPLCPDFVIELRSRTDALEPLHNKMQEYFNSGLRLGWLIDPQQQQTEIYRAGRDVEIVQFPIRLSGEDVLPGFLVELPL